jgi:Carboxypeptidase regulatory-like domain
MPTYLKVPVVILLLAGLGLAQDRGTIRGTVTDETGAAVPEATVTVRNVDTGLVQTLRTSSDGAYAVPYLPYGIYNVTIEKAGFRKAEAAHIQVNVNTVADVNMTLPVGSVDQKIEVTSTAPLLETQGSNLGRIMEAKTLEDLPLTIGGGLRSTTAFIQLMPGVLGSTSDNRIAGGLASGESYRLDGSESQSERRNDPGFNAVSVEALQEFKVQAGAFSAEYGRTSNGVVNFVTKSGTNELHGDGFLFNRNEFFNARGYTFTATTRAVSRQWNPGGNIGGPIYIPKVFDGRNKAFFSFTYELSNATSGRPTNLITVPIDEFRNGDMRKYVDSSGKMIPIYDPFNADGTINQNPLTRPQISCNGVLNVICPSRIDPTMKMLIGMLPQPDNPNLELNNTRSSGGGKSIGSVPSIKIDYIFSDKNRISGLFSRYWSPGQYQPNATEGLPPTGWPTDQLQRFLRFNHDYILRPNLLNHLTVGVNNRHLVEDPGNIDGVSDQLRKAMQIPGTTKGPIGGEVSQYADEWNQWGTDVHTDSIQSTWDIAEQLAWIKGRHSVKFGFDYVRPDYRRIDSNYIDGHLSFSSAATGNPGINGVTGSAWASSLLGLASAGTFAYGGDFDMIMPSYAWYVQDDFKVSKSLTINIGLRYDLPMAKTEVNANVSTFNPNLPNPAAGGILGAMEFAGNGSGRDGKNGFYQTRYNAFGPRLGIAYQIGAKTVIRAGGAIFFQPVREDGNADNGVQGFGGSYSPPANYFGSGISVLLSSGFLPYAAQVQANKPPVIDPGLQLFGSPYYWYPPKGRAPYFEDYQFTIEHNVTPNSLIRLTYHQNQGVKLQAQQQNLNQLDPKYWAIYGNLLGQTLQTLYNTPADVAILNANGFKLPWSTYPLTQQLQQALRPYPQYNSIGINAGALNDGHITFNDFEATLEHRFSHGLYVLSSYTFSKLIGNVDSEIGNQAGAQNTYNRRLDKAVSSADRPHTLSVATVYDLPVGRGKALWGGMSKAVDAVFGNWRISAILRYQSGGPLGLSCAQNLFGAGNPRCSFATGAGTTIPLINPAWNSSDSVAVSVPELNKAAFVYPANMTYGNTPIRIAQLRGPKTINEDISLLKNLHITERKYFEFRLSAFNALNRHIFPAPDTNMASATFGYITSPQGNTPRNVQLGLKFYF